jgi:hypothetical protein
VNKTQTSERMGSIKEGVDKLQAHPGVVRQTVGEEPASSELAQDTDHSY